MKGCSEAIEDVEDEEDDEEALEAALEPADDDSEQAE